MTTNPFIKTVTKREVIAGEVRLAGGTTLKINGVYNNFLYLSFSNGAVVTEGIGLTLPSLRDLATIFNEICDVMEEN